MAAARRAEVRREKSQHVIAEFRQGEFASDPLRQSDLCSLQPLLLLQRELAADKQKAGDAKNPVGRGGKAAVLNCKYRFAVRRADHEADSRQDGGGARNDERRRGMPQ